MYSINGSRTGARHKMKTINNYLNGRESGKIVGQIINVIIAVVGAVICIAGIWMQVTDKLL